MQIVDPTGEPCNDAGNYPLSVEAALDWCVVYEATVDFYGGRIESACVMVWLPDGRLSMQPTFIQAVEDMQRKVGEL